MNTTNKNKRLVLFTTYLKSGKFDYDGEQTDFNNGVTCSNITEVIRNYQTELPIKKNSIEHYTEEMEKLKRKETLNEEEKKQLTSYETLIEKYKQWQEVPHPSENYNIGSVMFLANEKIYPITEIPHELMHALGLKHPFKENEKKDEKKEHLFSKSATDNYMDYFTKEELDKNKPLFTQKWQWDIMRASPLLVKTLLVILSIFVSSCYKGGITRDIQNVSCTFNDSITQEEKKIDIRKYTLDEEIYDGNNIIVLSQVFDRYVKYVSNIDSKIIQYIAYDTLGRVLYNYSRLDNVTIGRLFEYDENGNIIKITNNDKEGELCAFQIMAIAKKYTKRKINKQNPDWGIEKYAYTNKELWYVYYTNSKGKSKILVIDPITGKILRELRVVLALDCDPTTNNNDIDEYNE